MGKHYSLEFKYNIVKLVLEEHWGIREAAQHFYIATHSSVVVRLQRKIRYQWVTSSTYHSEKSEKKRHFAIILKISKRY